MYGGMFNVPNTHRTVQIVYKKIRTLKIVQEYKSS